MVSLNGLLIGLLIGVLIGKVKGKNIHGGEPMEPLLSTTYNKEQK